LFFNAHGRGISGVLNFSEEARTLAHKKGLGKKARKSTLDVRNSLKVSDIY
jgi:hypothetical protein